MKKDFQPTTGNKPTPVVTFNNNNKPSLLLILLLGILSLSIGLWRIDEIPPGLYVDEGVYGLVALDIIEGKDGGPYFNRVWGVDALYGYLAAASFSLKKIFSTSGNTERQNLVPSLRAVSALGGTVVVVGVYILGSFLFDKTAGLFGAVFLCFARWLINFSRISFQGILLPAVAVLGVYYLLKGIYAPKKKRADFVIAGILWGLLFYTYLPSRLMPFMLLFFVGWKFYSDKKFWAENKRFIVVFVSSMFVVSLPLVVYFIKYPEMFYARASVVAYTGDSPSEILKNLIKTLGMFFVKGDLNPRHNIPGYPVLSKTVAVFFAGGLALSLKELVKFFFKKNSPQKTDTLSSQNFQVDTAIILLLWLFLMVVPSILSQEAPHSLRTIGAIPPVFILAGYFASTLFSLVKNKKLSRLLAVSFVVIVAYDGLRSYFSVWANLDSVRASFGYWKTDLARRTFGIGKGASYDVILPLSFWSDPSVNFIIRSEYGNKCGVLDGIDSLTKNYKILSRVSAYDETKNEDKIVVYMLSRVSEADRIIYDIFVSRLYPSSRLITALRNSNGNILYEYRSIPANALKDMDDFSPSEKRDIAAALQRATQEISATPWLKDQMRYLKR